MKRGGCSCSSHWSMGGVLLSQPARGEQQQQQQKEQEGPLVSVLGLKKHDELVITHSIGSTVADLPSVLQASL